VLFCKTGDAKGPRIQGETGNINDKTVKKRGIWGARRGMCPGRNRTPLPNPKLKVYPLFYLMGGVLDLIDTYNWKGYIKGGLN